MTSINEQNETVKKFSDLPNGATCWISIQGEPTEVRKTGFNAARKVAGRQGKTWVSPTRKVFNSEKEVLDDLDAMYALGRQVKLAVA